MKDLVRAFPDQLKQALEIECEKPLASGFSFNNILISGLGGSGIGGTIVSQLLATECRLPIAVNKDYFIPAYVDSKTLFIACSYSGNTEETLMATRKAHAKSSYVYCISSGGELTEYAKANKIDHCIIPGGMPPRSCLGFSIVQILKVLIHFNLCDSKALTEIESAAMILISDQDAIKKEAHAISKGLLGKTPVIYTTSGFEGVAIRFRQQINENSKMLCWHHVIPEMNHNELVGWRTPNEDLAVVILRNKNDFSRVQKRIEICKGLISKYTSNIQEIYSKGESKIEQTLYFIHLCDWVSCYLADLKEIDPVEVKVIDYLKGALADDK